MIRYYLRTAKQLRVLGVIGGAVLPSLVALALQGSLHGMSVLWAVPWAYVGYLVGSLYAELALARPAPARRTASLELRSLRDYLPGHNLWVQRALAGAVVVVGTVATAVDPAPVLWVDGYGTPRDATVLAGVAVAVAVLVEILERWIVRRPQPLSGPDLVAADDAIRAQSLHSLCGSGLALLVLLASAQAVVLGQRDVGDLRRPVFAAAALGLLASVITCMSFGHRAWRVRRPGPVLS